MFKIVKFSTKSLPDVLRANAYAFKIIKLVLKNNAYVEAFYSFMYSSLQY